MATTEDRNVGFDAGKAELLDLVTKLVPDGWLHDKEVETIDSKINDPANAVYILKVVDAIIDAVDASRAKRGTK